VTKRPNILWIIADELRTDALSCFGHPTARLQTPNIDAIADDGTLFLNTFCNSPICVSSRTSMLTGTLPEENTVYGNEAGWKSFELDVPLTTFPEHLARTGYRTVNFGKSHVAPGLNPWQTNDIRGGTIVDILDGCDPKKMDLIVTPTLKSPLGGVYPDDVPFPGELVTKNAISWLDREAKDGAPFLLRLSYLQPHTPVTPPSKYRDRFKGESYPELSEIGGTTSIFESMLADEIRGKSLSAEELRRVQYEYYGLVAWLDDQIGEVLGALRRLDLDRSTIIIFNSDHGVSIGERGLFSKLIFAPQVQRVPSIVAWKGTLAAGIRRSDISQLMDLPRTVCGLTGVPPADQFRGRNLFADSTPEGILSTVGFGQENSLAFPNSRFGAWPDGSGWPRRSCIRTSRYRLDMNVRKDGLPVKPSDEDIFLADCLADPHERTNLAGHAAYADVVARLAQLVRNHAATGLEPRFIPTFSDAERGVN
jgi:choline-sulfatase